MPNIATALGKSQLLRQFVGLSAATVIAEFELRAAGAVLLRGVKKKLGGKGSGRFYRSRKPGGGIHQASAPGEPPAKDTGELQKSVHIDILHTPNTVVRVIVDGKAAATLEFGSRSRQLMPRPYMRPVLVEVIPAMNITMRVGLKGNPLMRSL